MLISGHAGKRIRIPQKKRDAKTADKRTKKSTKTQVGFFFLRKRKHILFIKKEQFSASETTPKCLENMTIQ
jgi:hypothetical protein